MLHDGGEALRGRERQRAIEQRAQNGKDGGIGADADGEREDRHGREAGALSELAQRVAEVGHRRDYSTRKAASGSSRAALRAGTSAATTAHAVNTTSAVPIAIGSAGCTSYN